MLLHPCLECGTPSEGRRCDKHATARDKMIDQQRGSAASRGYDAAWRRLARRVIREHVAESGWVCPGWRRPPHAAEDLVADHVIPLAKGGKSVRSNVAVLCRRCNASKGDRTASPIDAGGFAAGGFVDAELAVKIG